MTQTTQICADQNLFAANQEFAREKCCLGLGLFLFGHASGGAAGPGGAAVEEAVGVAEQNRGTRGDEHDDQKMLSPQWH